jgi:hypothetical protein
MRGAQRPTNPIAFGFDTGTSQCREGVGRLGSVAALLIDHRALRATARRL